MSGSTVTARVNDAGLGDVYAEAQLAVPGLMLESAPVRWLGSAEVDNLTVRSVAPPVRRMADVPQTGKLLAGDDFSSGLGADWSWVRQDDKAVVADGKLSWPLENADLVGGGNNAGLLFQPRPIATAGSRRPSFISTPVKATSATTSRPGWSRT